MGGFGNKCSWTYLRFCFVLKFHRTGTTIHYSFIDEGHQCGPHIIVLSIDLSERQKEDQGRNSFCMSLLLGIFLLIFPIPFAFFFFFVNSEIIPLRSWWFEYYCLLGLIRPGYVYITQFELDYSRVLFGLVILAFCPAHIQSDHVVKPSKKRVVGFSPCLPEYLRKE